MDTTQFVAPASESNKLDVALIPPGQHLCTLYGICDLGTHSTTFGDKRQMMLAFEFPTEMRVFYEGDPAKPCAIFQRETFSMSNKSNLRTKFVNPMLGRNITDEEAKNFNHAQLLGKHFVATIVHSADGQYANIQTLTPLNQQNMVMFGLQTPSTSIINPVFIFHLSQGFMSENFKNLPKFLRTKLMESAEGIQHKAQGGTFNLPTEGENSAGTAVSPGAPAARTLEPVPGSAHSIESLRAGGWTEQQMVDAGYAKWSAPVVPPTPAVPAPAAPAPPATPVASAAATPPPTPAPAAAAPPPAPAAPAPVANAPIMHEGKPIVGVQGVDIHAYIAGGWTPAQLIQHSKAVFQ